MKRGDGLSPSGGLINELSTRKAPSLLCFSHLRWNFVFQRPQHLMTHAARSWRVFFWEEPVWVDPETESGLLPRLELRRCDGGVVVATPVLPYWTGDDFHLHAQRQLLDQLVQEQQINSPLLWYYTPDMLRISNHLSGSAIVYDCMDELSAFRGADPALAILERDLLTRADLVFTGGYSLYEAKRQQHPRVHPFPSGVDIAHFRPARTGLPEPEDQAKIPQPRLGFYGVIDERLDRSLLAAVADLRPDWQIVLVGPVLKIERDELPRRRNIHYLGRKPYSLLPAYLSGWDVALMPFALNAATRFISPTKTPEYLAGGRPVVSTPIVDVAHQYGKVPGVAIASTAEEFVKRAEECLALGRTPGRWVPGVDRLLEDMSWDRIWQRMAALIEATVPRTIERRMRSVLAKGRQPKRRFDALVVGAGFAGSVMAERLAASGRTVGLVDRRPHIAGNAFDHPDEAGILVHKYGPHIFHTNSQRIVEYLSRFTEWRPYEHRVLARIGDALLPIPINRTTVSRFFGLELSEQEVAAFLASKAEPISVIRSSADVVLSQVGRELYEAFFRGYTRKQWGIDPSELDKSVTARIPTRTNDDDRYFADSFQAMPLHGFTRMFERMLDHPRITLMLGTDYREIRREVDFDHLVYTGPIDEYFDHRFGKLPYRSLHFRHETLNTAQHQRVAVVNYPSEAVPYTRVTEFKHLTGQSHPKTSICFEFPGSTGDPYYPIPRPENAALYAQYQALADATPNVTFVGRLATYRYYNMDQVVAQALSAFERLVRPAVSHRREEAGVRRTGRVEATPPPGNLLLSREEAGGGGGG